MEPDPPAEVVRDVLTEQTAAYTELMSHPVYHPTLGMISGMAAAMLADIADRPPWLRIMQPPGKCYMVGDAVVHIKPECRCPRRRR